MWTSVASTPNLFAIAWRTAQHGKARIGIMALTTVWPRSRTTTSYRREDSARHRRSNRRPPSGRVVQGLANREEARPALHGRGIEKESRAVVPVAIARSTELHIHGRGDDIEHAVQLVPETRRQGTACPARLGGGHDRQLGNEAVIVEGHLSIDTAGKGVAVQLVFQNPCGLLGPTGAFSEQVEGKRRDQEPGRLGDDVIVGGGASTTKGCQVVLVPPDLGTCHFVALEELSGPIPPVEQSSHPDP